MVDEEVRRRIIVGVDGSEPSKRALRWAGAEASRSGALLVAVLSWEPPVNAGWTNDELPEIEAEVERESRDRLEGTVRDVLDGNEEVALELLPVQSKPASVLVAQSADAELLVVGRSGHGALADAVLGSVSNYCVHHARCPVVVVP